jgi:UV DNA damage endonuclease
MAIGYCCISNGINKDRRPKDHIKVNRGMIRKTFLEKGLPYASELTVLNLIDCLEVLKYNVRNKIFVYRLSSDMIPWFSEYSLEELPDYTKICNLFKKIGDYAKSNSMRLSTHPGPYTVLASETESVVEKSIDDLNKHSQMMDLMGLDATRYYPINIHINTTQPTREEAAERFTENFFLLDENTRKRLTIENDDKLSQYSVKMLYNMLYKQIKISITFDQHHYKYGPQDQTMEEALKLAYSTWGDIKPLTHMSSSRRIEDVSSKETAHADFLYEKIETFGLDFDTDLECKEKDIALFKYRKDYGVL